MRGDGELFSFEDRELVQPQTKSVAPRTATPAPEPGAAPTAGNGWRIVTMRQDAPAEGSAWALESSADPANTGSQAPAWEPDREAPASRSSFPLWNLETHRSTANTVNRAPPRLNTALRYLAMPRSRYRVRQESCPHFLAATVNHWLPLFTRPETVNIVLDSWRFLQRETGLVIYGYVILENHLHLVAKSENLSRIYSVSSPSRPGESLPIWRAEIRPGFWSYWLSSSVRTRPKAGIRFGRKAVTLNSLDPT
jgi:hypothetical protein